MPFVGYILLYRHGSWNVLIMEYGVQPDRHLGFNHANMYSNCDPVWENRAYLKVSRNAGFKYLVCCSSPMVEAMCTKISHVLHQFQSIHCASSQQRSFLPF